MEALLSELLRARSGQGDQAGPSGGQSGANMLQNPGLAAALAAALLPQTVPGPEPAAAAVPALPTLPGALTGAPDGAAFAQQLLLLASLGEQQQQMQQQQQHLQHPHPHLQLVPQQGGLQQAGLHALPLLPAGGPDAVLGAAELLQFAAQGNVSGDMQQQ